MTPRRPSHPGLAVEPDHIASEAGVLFLTAARAHWRGHIAERGRTYARQGRVLSLMILNNRAKATVAGHGATYRVTLEQVVASADWSAAGGSQGGVGLRARCDCPYGSEEGNWCKHAVAVSFVAASALDEQDVEAPTAVMQDRDRRDSAVSESAVSESTVSESVGRASSPELAVPVVGQAIAPEENAPEENAPEENAPEENAPEADPAEAVDFARRRSWAALAGALGQIDSAEFPEVATTYAALVEVLPAPAKVARWIERQCLKSAVG